MGKYQGYEKYKDSGVEWLGEIPEHWQSLKIKRLTAIKRGASPRPIDDPKYFDDDGEYAWVRIADVTASERYLETTTQKVSQLGKSFSVPLEPGKLFLSIAGSVGKPIITKIKCCIHDGFVYFPDLKVNEEFIYYIFNSGQPYLGLGKLGTQLNLNTETVGAITIGLPPLDEQETIARFLDYKTKQIDDLIAKKEALIEKLDEKRTALISHAVTKGLDPTVPMKDSGVECLGEIPEHWEVIKIKFIGDIKYGLGEPPEKMDDGLPIIRATDIYRGIIDGSKVQRVNPDKVPWSRNPELKADDILVVRSGAYTGDSAIVTDEWAGSIAGYDMVLTPTKAYSKYIALNLLSKHILEGQIYLAKSRAAQPHLNAEELGNTIIAIPHLKEQKIISQYLVQKTAEIDQQKAKIQQAIELLKEYRTALITNAVTGKIDVRQVPISEAQKPA